MTCRIRIFFDFHDCMICSLGCAQNVSLTTSNMDQVMGGPGVGLKQWPMAVENGASNGGGARLQVEGKGAADRRDEQMEETSDSQLMRGGPSRKTGAGSMQGAAT